MSITRNTQNLAGLAMMICLGKWERNGLWECGVVPRDLAMDPFEVVASEESESDPFDAGRQSMYSDSGSSITSKLAFGACRPFDTITFSGVDVRDADIPSSMWVLPRSGDEDRVEDNSPEGDLCPGAVITVLPEPQVDEDGDVGYSG